MSTDLFDYLDEKERQILDYIETSMETGRIKPSHLKMGALAYIGRKAKRLRPSVLTLSSGSTGGAKMEKEALPAAVAVELFHTWTLVHDDIIDEDDLRRNQPSVHKLIEAYANDEGLLNRNKIEKYGVDIAMLAGDIQHGLSVGALADCAFNSKLNPILILQLIKYLEEVTLCHVLHGEAVDVQLGYRDLQSNYTIISDDEILNMIYLKTGALFEFSGFAGAMIGKNTTDVKDPEVVAISEFAKKCGIAFQLQDDILGILGNQSSLGKPIGSDIREGKKTTIVMEALRNAGRKDKEFIFSVYGKENNSMEDTRRLIVMLSDLNGIKHTRELSVQYLLNAISCLDILPESSYKRLLYSWADFMINRDF